MASRRFQLCLGYASGLAERSMFSGFLLLENISATSGSKLRWNPSESPAWNPLRRPTPASPWRCLWRRGPLPAELSQSEVGTGQGMFFAFLESTLFWLYGFEEKPKGHRCWGPQILTQPWGVRVGVPSQTKGLLF